MPTPRPLRIPGVDPHALEATHRVCLMALDRTDTPRTCSLAFSAGKDSVATWAVLAHYFEMVRPVFWYLVPGLRFVQEALDYYEDLFGVPISQLPHPDRLDLIQGWCFQPPYRITALHTVFEDFESYTMDQLVAEWRPLVDLGPRTSHATGIRASDTPTRRDLIRKHKGFAPNGQTFFPLAEWKVADVEAALWWFGLHLPVEYRWYGRSYDGIMYRYIAPIAEHYPDDMQRIRDDFPMVDAEFVRRQMIDRHLRLETGKGIDEVIPVYKAGGQPSTRPPYADQGAQIISTFALRARRRIAQESR